MQGSQAYSSDFETDESSSRAASSVAEEAGIDEEEGRSVDWGSFQGAPSPLPRAESPRVTRAVALDVNRRLQDQLGRRGMVEAEEHVVVPAAQQRRGFF